MLRVRPKLFYGTNVSRMVKQLLTTMNIRNGRPQQRRSGRKTPQKCVRLSARIVVNKLRKIDHFWDKEQNPSSLSSWIIHLKKVVEWNIENNYGNNKTSQRTTTILYLFLFHILFIVT